MRDPDFSIDGWSLEDGEAYHREAPLTFPIPDLAVRGALQRGDFAKLIFLISTDSDEEPLVVERMWVIVREHTKRGYVGMLANEPSGIQRNDDFWWGTDCPSSPGILSPSKTATQRAPP